MDHKELGAFLLTEEGAGILVRHPNGVSLGPGPIGDADDSKGSAIDEHLTSDAPASALGRQLPDHDLGRIRRPGSLEEPQAKRGRPGLEGDAAELDRDAVDPQDAEDD